MINEEHLRFVNMVQTLICGKAREAQISCPGPGAARKLRRRMYHMRDLLLDNTTADKLRFRLNGCILIIELKPEWQPKLIQENQPNETQSNNDPHS